MKLSHLALLATTITSMSIAKSEAAVKDAPPPDESVVAANNAFAFDLYTQLREEPGNIFYSPFSISIALAMTSAGARGETAQEMAAVLHMPDQPNRTAGYAQLQRHIDAAAARGKAELALANSLWGQKDYPYQQEFLALLERDFAAALYEVDYRTAAADAADRMNQWVEKQTRNRISNLIPRSALTPDTRLVLINAIYFKGRWDEPFQKDRTQDRPFHVTADRSVRVPMMHHHSTMAYFEDEQLQALRLPYEQEELSMLILLPREKHALAAAEQGLSAERCREIVSQLGDATVDLQLPRFRVEAQFELSETLAELGMKRAFTPHADFSGIASHEPLLISKVVHKAFVDVNEEGTEAAAATGVIVGVASVAQPPRTVRFHVDQPFLFAIIDREGTILFLGRVTDPTK